jgi:hypothetical protein
LGFDWRWGLDTWRRGLEAWRGGNLFDSRTRRYLHCRRFGWPRFSADFLRRNLGDGRRPGRSCRFRLLAH